jgi:anti-anti-sigma factor
MAVDQEHFVLRGEVNVWNADALMSELRVRASTRTGPLVVDCMDLESVDVAGLWALVIVDNELRRQRRRLVLVNASGDLRRAVACCGLTDLLTCQAGAGSGTAGTTAFLHPN